MDNIFRVTKYLQQFRANTADWFYHCEWLVGHSPPALYFALIKPVCRVRPELVKHLHLFTAILLSLLLSSCAHVKKDGPPNFYVDETKIPNATPKVERLSKYGNMRYYWVFGKRYYTMRNYKNYNEVGVASWYGTKFHTHHTSSGERYNMLAMTAAHRSLPLPTYVEVTNLKNQRKVIVKVNDRGPFASNRIIDLSYVAAKKLGMLGHGTTTVRVKAIDPRTYGKTYGKAHRRLRGPKTRVKRSA